MERPLRSVGATDDRRPGAPPRDDERLREWADILERLQWSAVVLDADWNLVWVSPELKEFLDADDGTDVGIGLHIAEAWTKEVWLSSVAAESQLEVVRDFAPYMLHHFDSIGRDLRAILPEQFLPLLDGIEPQPPPLIWPESFQYVGPRTGDDPKGYRVDGCWFRVNDDDGMQVGVIGTFFIGMRPNLLALLARGDDQMYERMAKLVEPRRTRAAVLFCDLHESVRLSRQLPTAGYFKLVRALSTGIDQVIADEMGIVGKHAGDGASGFFLADDLGSPSAAAAAAIRAARRIHRVGEDVFREAIDGECHMKIGVHWGNGLYMGQLVPGGRLDVTALGDEVNETARVQECASSGTSLATKYLLEQLDPEDAASLGIDLTTLTYTTLGDLESASPKGAADAGTLPVTRI